MIQECRNCRRAIEWSAELRAWFHARPEEMSEPYTCTVPEPHGWPRSDKDAQP